MCRPAELPKEDGYMDEDRSAIEAAKRYQLVPGETLYCEGALRPSWRGVLHTYSFFLLPLPLYFLVREADSATEVLAISLFGFASAMLFLCSFLYHRVNWSPAAEVLAQKIDHCGIFIVIAGNVTPLCLLAMRHMGPWVLGGAWALCAWGIRNVFCLKKRLHHFVFAAAVVLGGFHELMKNCTSMELTLTVLAWGQWILGLALYSSGKPRLWPNHFSAHEVMHLLVSSATATACVVNYSLLRRFDVTQCWFTA